MNRSRYDDLLANPTWTLNDAEIKEGWHFCMDFDGRPIRNTWPQMEKCGCPELQPCQQRKEVK